VQPAALRFLERPHGRLRTGEPQNEVKHGGQNLFEMLYSDPARLASFLGR
jgi:hypothetical protein